jgi:hypothetical protein
MTGNFRNMFATFVIAAGMAGVAAPAHATPILEQRCASDSLTPGAARVRLEWARQCGDRMNVRSPSMPVAPAFSYATGATSSNGIALIEYVEMDGPPLSDAFFGKNSF